MPLVTSQSVMCKICGIGTESLQDLDSRPGMYWVEIKWGANMLFGNGVAFWEDFDDYKVLMVDEHGVVVPNGEAGATPRVSKERSSCCNPNEYSLVVQGKWAAGAKKFMIVPTAKATSGVSGVGAREMFTLPVGMTTADFEDDASRAPATKYTGSLTLEVSNPETFVMSPHAPAIIKDGLVAASPALKSDMISIVKVSVPQSSLRRLSAAKTAAFRRLPGSSVVVDYLVLTRERVALSSNSINATKMMAAVSSSANAVGMTDFNILSVEIPEPIPESLGTIDVALSGTTSMAGGLLFALILSVIALANH